MPDPILEARALTRVVGDAVLVDDVSFRVPLGAVFIVFGASGAGKSSLLRLLNRLDEPSGGTVYLDGTDYTTLPPRELRRRVGLVPQQPSLTDGTALDNVTWGPRLRGETVDEDEARAMLDELGLAGLADQDADALSGGEAQRVAVARALMNRPDVLLLDEPASSLDADSARRVEDQLTRVIDDFGLTAVLVTHDADRARRLGTQGIRLTDGQVTARGALDDVLADASTPVQ